MDDVIVSQNCVGYYWGYTYVRNGAYSDSRFKWPRSPAIVYRPTVPNPKLTFNVVCPINSNGVLVNSVSMYGVSLAPRCTCQEENKFQSLQSQPFNNALNGNFADYDLSQENPVSGWTSQETWRGFVIPVQYTGPMSADDKSNNGAV